MSLERFKEEKLQQFDVSVLRFTKELRLIDLLKADTVAPVQLTDIGVSRPFQVGHRVVFPRGTIVQTTSEQTMLAETYASFCILCLTFDTFGKAIIFHENYLQLDKKMKKYRERLSSVFGDTPTITVIGGLRESFAYQYDCLKTAKEILDETSTTVSVVSVHGSSISLMPPFVQYNPPDACASGLIFIPKSFTRENKNTLVTVGALDSLAATVWITAKPREF